MGAAVNMVEIRTENAVWLACTDETRARLQERGDVCTFEAGELLFSEGDRLGLALIPLRGRLQVCKTGRGGRRQVLCKLDPVKCGGPCMLLMGETSLGDVHGLESGAYLAVKREDLEELAIQDPALGSVVLRGAVRCMTHFITAMENLSFNKVGQRVALALLEATGGNGNVVRQTQAELAAEVGTTREVVARCLAELQDAGIIRLGRGRISVLERDRLSQFC